MIPGSLITTLMERAGVVIPVTKSGLVFAATGGRIGYNSANPIQSGGSRYCFVVRAPIQITTDVEFIELHWDNQYWAGNNISNNGSARELVRYALEKFDASAYAPILFDGGAENCVIPQGGHVSTRIYPSAFGLTKFSAGEIYYLRAKERVTPGGVHIISSYAGGVTAALGGGTGQLRSQYYDEATESGLNIYATGVIPSQTGQFQTGAAHPFPQAIVGKPLNSNVMSVINNGDSIDWGFGDSQSGITQRSGTGFFDRATTNGSGVADICSMNAARPAGSAAGMNVPLITQYYQYANVLHHGHGVNDIGITGTPNLSAVYTAMESLWQKARDEGIKIILKRLLLPVASTSNNFTNLAGQTINPRFTSGASGDLFEARMQQYVTENVLDLTYQAHTNVSDPTTRYAWLTNGTNNYVTQDGVHEQPQGNILTTPSCRTALQAANSLLQSKFNG